MDLAVGSNLEFEMLLVVERLASHDGLWTDGVQDTSLYWEVVQHLHGTKHNVDQQKLWDPVEGKAVSDSPTPFLDHLDSILDLGDVFACACQVDSRATWYSLYHSLHWRKLSIGVYRRDSEALIEVELVDLLESFEDALDLPISQVVHRSEAYTPAECQEEWNLVDKEDVRCYVHFLVELQELLWDLDKVRCHMYRS